ncbi:MAG: maltose/moltooligosaccharide transporter [Clostridiales bacterium]|jgi:MFS family permease|nr:maltose/moltooligosaccharide transporter [Clostridiales bacterium]
MHISSLVKDGTDRLSYPKALFLGLGFFIVTATWTLYNSFVPIFLKNFIESQTLIGFIMTFDNIAAVTIQPFFGALSDNTYTRFGHRMPYLMIGIPIAALFYALIPFAETLWLILTFIIIMNFAMSVFRSPVIALMPDLTPPKLRSKANGVINFMGGLGAILTFLVGSKLYDINRALPFVLFSVLMVLILILFLRKLREPQKPTSEEKVDILGVIRSVFHDQNRAVLNVLMAIFFWFFGYSAVETFFTLYGKEFLLVKESEAAMSLTFFSLTFVIFSIPSGLIATKAGRKKTILIGIMGLIVIFAVLVLVKELLAIRILLLIGGIFWALININSYPMVVEKAGGSIGAFTGLYYFFSTIPAILSPVVVGFFIEYVGYPMLFISALISFILALAFMLQVRQE